MITSISYDQSEILHAISQLHLNGQCIQMDATFSKGVFYKKFPLPQYRYDLVPVTQGVIACDCRNLPHENASINSIIFDPPFLATSGPSLKENNNSNVTAKRFSVYKSEKALWEFYQSSMQEFSRILKPKGILIFKCQDKVSSGKQYFLHSDIYQYAKTLKFYPLDLFILLAKSRITAAWQMNQKHCRKFHAYFWVFKKMKEKNK